MSAGQYIPCKYLFTTFFIQLDQKSRNKVNAGPGSSFNTVINFSLTNNLLFGKNIKIYAKIAEKYTEIVQNVLILIIACSLVSTDMI